MRIRNIMSALLLFSVSHLSLATQPVSLSISNMSVALDNGLLRVEFKDDASATAIVKNGVNLVNNLSGAERDPSKHRSSYLDFHSKGVKDFTPDHLEVIHNDENIAHIAWIDDKENVLRLEYHLIMRKGISGVYSYVVAENTEPETVLVSELRNVYRFNPQLLDHLFNGEHHGKPYLYPELEKMPKVQDETWQLPSGEVYTKYDFAGYQHTTPFWGVYGNNMGVWLIHGSDEYFSGDDLKQDLMVHQDAIILNYMTGAHLGTPDMLAPSGWKKFYGPWLLYVNQGDTKQMLSDANQQAQKEHRNWPYSWVDDARYVVKRTTVTGSINSKTPATVILSSSQAEDFDVQTLGYLFSTDTDSNGNFQLENVIPSDYKLVVHAKGGNQAGILLEQNITVQGDKQNLGKLNLAPETKVLWAIGQADRQAGEFRFGQEQRDYKWQKEVPANLTFHIGRSDYRKDWYYAQTQKGSWDIHFNIQPDKPSYQLNIALAAASNSGMGDGITEPKLAVTVNGQLVETLQYKNDKALYRSALRNGRYHLAPITVPANLLHSGDNQISLQLEGGAVMYDIITLSE